MSEHETSVVPHDTSTATPRITGHPIDELLRWLAVYTAFPLGWTDEQIGILRDEIKRRQGTENCA